MLRYSPLVSPSDQENDSSSSDNNAGTHGSGVANKGDWAVVSDESIETTLETWSPNSLTFSPDAREGWAIGFDNSSGTSKTTFLHFLENKWSVVENPTDYRISSVAWAAPGEAWAIASPSSTSGSGASFMLRYSGGAWDFYDPEDVTR